jgi:hypothetical protein
VSIDRVGGSRTTPGHDYLAHIHTHPLTPTDTSIPHASKTHSRKTSLSSSLVQSNCRGCWGWFWILGVCGGSDRVIDGGRPIYIQPRSCNHTHTQSNHTQTLTFKLSTLIVVIPVRR